MKHFVVRDQSAYDGEQLWNFSESVNSISKLPTSILQLTDVEMC
jgi:hypothetical protein